MCTHLTQERSYLAEAPSSSRARTVLNSVSVTIQISLYTDAQWSMSVNNAQTSQSGCGGFDLEYSCMSLLGGPKTIQPALVLPTPPGVSSTPRRRNAGPSLPCGSPPNTGHSSSCHAQMHGRANQRAPHATDRPRAASRARPNDRRS